MERIDSIDDPRVAAYRNLRDRTLRGENLFIAEGRLLTERLLRSGYPTESVFVARQHADEFARLVPRGTPLYVADESLLSQVAGFDFHRGAMAAGRRGTPPAIDELVALKPIEGPLRLAICPETASTENLGMIFRSAAAFDVDGVLLGERCCDPLSRRALRLSMGGVLQVPFSQSADLAAAMRRLRERWKVEIVATVLDDRAERLASFRWSPRTALVFGNEYHGLRRPWLEECDRRVTIPMRPGFDSLNLGVAAGIFLYEACKRAAGP